MKLKVSTPRKTVSEGSEFYKRYVQEKQKQEQKETQRQLELGFCDAIHPPSRSGNIKAELTADKNRIFVVDSFSGNSREYERKIKTPFGESLVQKVLVGRTKGGKKEYGVLKQKHQAVMYELFRFWAQGERKLVQVGGKPRAVIITTAYHLAKAICNNDSSRSYQYIREILRDLASIPIFIQNAYTNSGISEIEFTILGEFGWRTRRRKNADSKQNLSQIHIQLSDIATRGLVHGYVKDFSLDVYKKIGGTERQGKHKTTAATLYSFLDTELISKETYNISLINLLGELGMRSYEYKSQRKEKIASAIQTLNGVEICGGTHYLDVSLRYSKELNDYILEAQRCLKVPTR